MTPAPAMPISVEVAARAVSIAGGDTFASNIGRRLTSYEHTITSEGGFESCTLPFVAESWSEALTWADRLACVVASYGPHGEQLWDGLIFAVELRRGGRARTYSLEPVANRVRTSYTTALGTPRTTAAASNAASVALYGVRDALLSVEARDLTDATGQRDTYLAAFAFPRAEGETALDAAGDSTDPIEVTLQCRGRYYTLDDALVERADTSSEAATAQVATLLGSAAPGVGAINSWISPTLRLIGGATGKAISRKIEANTTYRQAIETRLASGDTTNRRFAWGVYEDRALRLAVSAEGSGVIGYRVRLDDGTIFSGDGGPVPPWSVRPDALVEDAAMLSVGPRSGAVEQTDRFYLRRVVFRMDRGGAWELRMEPSVNRSIDVRIAQGGR